MKKILITILIILLCVLAYNAIFKGITISKLNILSVKQIEEANGNLDDQIKQTQTLMYTDYPTERDRLDQKVSSLMTAKDEYLDLAEISTEGELAKANQEETYTVEFLLTRLGRLATKQGVYLKYDITSGNLGQANIKNINFTVEGDYIPTIDFLEALEDDSKLGFRIENFKMVPSNDYILRTTFTVKNVKIKLENVSTSSTASATTSTNNNSSTTQTDTKQTNTTTNTTTSTNTTTDKPIVQQEMNAIGGVTDTINNLTNQ